MTLRKKIRIILGISMLILLLLLDLIFTGVLRTASYQASKERMTRDLTRVVGLINGEAQSLSAISATWAYSDSTWDYMQKSNENFVLPTINQDMLTEIGISSIILLDIEQKVVLQKDYSPYNEPSSPQSELTTIFSNPKNIEMIENMSDQGVSGLALRENEPILFSLKPILTSHMQRPIAGYLLATKAFNSDLVQQMSESLHFDFIIDPTDDSEKSDSNLGETIIDEIRRKNPLVAGKMLVKDHMGVPSFWIRGTAPREDTSAIEKRMQYLFLILAACVLLLCCAIDFVLKHILYNRLKTLEDEAEAIRDDAETSDSITIDNKKDEISDLQQAVSDVIAHKEYSCKMNTEVDKISLTVYERFAAEGTRLCLKTVEEIAASLTPGDEKYRNSIVNEAKTTERFCARIGIPDNELMFSYLGALFNRIGLTGIPFSIRNKTAEMTIEEEREYKNYPFISRDILKSVEILHSSTAIPCNWNENWDGTGFPNGKKGTSIPIEARAFAVVDEWNKLTLSRFGCRPATQEEVEVALRAMKGTRLDSHLVEEFIGMLKEDTE